MLYGERKMKYLRTVAGILLILAAIGGLVFWETQGRELVMTEPVLAAKETILAGTVVKESDFMILGVFPENRIEGALKPDERRALAGKTVTQMIPRNAQITEAFFQNDEFCLAHGQSLYVIRPEWIAMRSSSLRRGDLVRIVTEQTNEALGVYRIAFVKDENEIEIRDTEGAARSVLDRTDAGSVISHVEIISDEAGYRRIQSRATGSPAEKLILIQEVASN